MEMNMDGTYDKPETNCEHNWDLFSVDVGARWKLHLVWKCVLKCDAIFTLGAEAEHIEIPYGIVDMFPKPTVKFTNTGAYMEPGMMRL